jgi:hypothetical protein
MYAARSGDTRARFWAKVDKSGECWLWLGGKAHRGHGRVKWGGRFRPAHRIAYELLVGPVPEGLCVLHNCPGGDNPACVRPSHLWLGSKTDNNRDRDAKGRTAHQKGSAHGLSKLTEDDVRLIRQRRADGATLTAIAAEFGVIFQNISLIVNRKAWRHVE